MSSAQAEKEAHLALIMQPDDAMSHDVLGKATGHCLPRPITALLYTECWVVQIYMAEGHTAQAADQYTAAIK